MRQLLIVLVLLPATSAAALEWVSPEKCLRSTKGKLAAALVVSESAKPEAALTSDVLAKVVADDPKIAASLKGFVFGRVNCYKDGDSDRKVVEKWGEPLTLRLYIGGGPQPMWKAKIAADSDATAIAKQLTTLGRVYSSVARSLDRIKKQFGAKTIKSREMEDSRAQLALAKAFERTKSISLAFKHYDKAAAALKKEKKKAEAAKITVTKARFAEREKDFDSAIKLLRQYVKKNKTAKDRGLMLVEICRLYAANGDDKTARKVAKSILADKSLEPQHGPARKYAK